jgi:hypothetical protein
MNRSWLGNAGRDRLLEGIGIPRAITTSASQPPIHLQSSKNRISKNTYMSCEENLKYGLHKVTAGRRRSTATVLSAVGG